MKILAATVSLACLLSTPLLAQVRVELLQDQEQFLPNETIPVSVRIINRAGQTLNLGGDDVWITFSVESRDGFVVQKLGEPPVKGEFILPSGKMATVRAELTPYFGLGRPGRYSVRATVRIKAWGTEVASPPRTFDIIAGTK